MITIKTGESFHSRKARNSFFMEIAQSPAQYFPWVMREASIIFHCIEHAWNPIYANICTGVINCFHCHASFYLFSTYLWKYTLWCICEITQKYVFAKIHISVYLQKYRNKYFSQVTHSPPRGILDKNAASSASGCAALAKELSSR